MKVYFKYLIFLFCFISITGFCKLPKKIHKIDIKLEIKERSYLTDRITLKIKIFNNLSKSITVVNRPGDCFTIANFELKTILKSEGNIIPYKKEGVPGTSSAIDTLKPQQTKILHWNLHDIYDISTGMYKIKLKYYHKPTLLDYNELRKLGLDLKKPKDRTVHIYKGESKWHTFGRVEDKSRSERIEKLKNQLSSGDFSKVSSVLSILNAHPEYHFKRDDLTKMIFELLNSGDFEIQKAAYIYLYRVRNRDREDYKFRMMRGKWFEKFLDIVDDDKLEQLLLKSIESKDYKFRLATAQALCSRSSPAVFTNLYIKKISYKNWLKEEEFPEIRSYLIRRVGKKQKPGQEYIDFVKNIALNDPSGLLVIRI